MILDLVMGLVEDDDFSKNRLADYFLQQNSNIRLLIAAESRLIN